MEELRLEPSFSWTHVSDFLTRWIYLPTLTWTRYHVVPAGGLDEPSIQVGQVTQNPW